MKKVLLLFTGLISFISISLAQITLTDQNNLPINNGDVRIFNTDGDEANLITSIKNNDSGQIELKLKAVNVTGTDGSGLEFCFGTSCYMGISTGNIYPLSGHFNLDAGATNNETHFHHHIHTGDPDVTEYVLKIYEDGHEADNYVQFTYKYDANYVGINDINKKNTVSIYPNPAKDKFTVIVPENQINSELKMSNILGKTVKTIPLKQSKTTVIAEELPSGIYFVSIIQNGKIINTKKLILK